MRALLLALLLFVAPALAETPAALSFEGETGDAIFTTEPCTQAKLALGLLVSGPEQPFFAGTATSKDKSVTMKLCWARHGDHIDVYDESGDSGAVPNDKLKPIRPI